MCAYASACECVGEWVLSRCVSVALSLTCVCARTHTQLDAGKKKSENISAQLSSSVQACKSAHRACRELQDKNALLNEALLQQVLECVPEHRMCSLTSPEHRMSSLTSHCALGRSFSEAGLMYTRTGTHAQAHTHAIVNLIYMYLQKRQKTDKEKEIEQLSMATEDMGRKAEDMAGKASSIELLLQEERRRMQSPRALELSSETAWAYNYKCVLARGAKKHLPGLISPTMPPDSLSPAISVHGDDAVSALSWGAGQCRRHHAHSQYRRDNAHSATAAVAQLSPVGLWKVVSETEPCETTPLSLRAVGLCVGLTCLCVSGLMVCIPLLPSHARAQSSLGPSHTRALSSLGPRHGVTLAGHWHKAQLLRLSDASSSPPPHPPLPPPLFTSKRVKGELDAHWPLERAYDAGSFGPVPRSPLASLDASIHKEAWCSREEGGGAREQQLLRKRWQRDRQRESACAAERRELAQIREQLARVEKEKEAEGERLEAESHRAEWMSVRAAAAEEERSVIDAQLEFVRRELDETRKDAEGCRNREKHEVMTREIVDLKTKSEREMLERQMRDEEKFSKVISKVVFCSICNRALTF